MPIETLGLDHVDLTVKDMERSTRFYGRVLTELGFRQESERSWASAQLSIALLPEAERFRGDEFDRTRAGLHHLAFRCRRADDVDAFHRFLLSSGIPVLDPPTRYPRYGQGYYAVFFADPDGMKLELVHYPWGYWKRVLSDGKDERPRGA